MFKKLLFFAVLLATQIQNAESSELQLKFLQDLNLPSTHEFHHMLFGGISAAIKTESANEYLLLSDDRGSYGLPRFYRTKFKFSNKKLSFEITDFIPFKHEDKTVFEKSSIDGEGFIALKDGGYMVSSEGDVYKGTETTKDTCVQPIFLRFDEKGTQQGRLQIPMKFFPDNRNDEGCIFAVAPASPLRVREQTKGMRNNRGFEGVAPALSGQFFFAAAEAPLVQDDTPPDLKKGGLVRFVKYDMQASLPMPSAEFAYELDPVPNSENISDYSVMENGISEILSIDDDLFLVIERGGIVRKSDKVFVAHARLYLADFSGADNVSEIDALKGPRPIVAAQKRLLVDFNKLTKTFSKNFQSIDNFETLAYGPKLPNGNQTLIVVSDNNFSNTQRTQILFFEIQTKK